MLDDYGVKKKPITTRNPQANAIVERVHQTIGNIHYKMKWYTWVVPCVPVRT
jgi:hypothetical protein